MSFSDVLGHGARVAELRRALAEDRLPHAILLTGKRGVGKRRLADALAAARLCEREGAAGARVDPGDGAGRNDDACGRCTSCHALAHGNHPDLELVERTEGKRDVGIEQIRLLSERLFRKDHRGRGKVAIVDDADRLTNQAQNAFLKTLEEPPRGTTIVLVSSNAARLLPTVRSRCSIHRFGSLTSDELLTFASRAGVDPQAVPLALARGAPGKLLLLSRPDVVRARHEAVRFATRPAAVSPFDFAAELLEHADAGAREGDEVAPEEIRERVRDRLRIYLRLVSAAFRDLRIVALGLADVPLLHADHAADFETAVASTAADGPDRYEAAGEICEVAVGDLRGNIDRALLLEDAARRIRLELAV